MSDTSVEPFPPLAGTYHSAYGMVADGISTMISDLITFQPDGVTTVGVGEQAGDGLRIQLLLFDSGETLLSGKWSELGPEGQVVSGGLVEFEREEGNNRLVGYWATGTEEDKSPDNGTWILVRSAIRQFSN